MESETVVFVVGNGFSPGADEVQSLGNAGQIPRSAIIQTFEASWRSPDEAESIANSMIAKMSSKVISREVSLISVSGREFSVTILTIGLHKSVSRWLLGMAVICAIAFGIWWFWLR